MRGKRRLADSVCQSGNMPPINPPPRDLWAITAYFNPAGFRRRLSNYRHFRRSLGVPLITAELSFTGRFELDSSDAEILLQVTDGDVMWQKERLLNLAITALPRSCRKVVWLDCDLIFDSPNWAQETSERLDDLPLVQPFSRLHRPPPDWHLGDSANAGSDILRPVPVMIERGMTLDDCMNGHQERTRIATGMAWATRRSLLEAHGLYDASIIGGGDSALVRAAYGYLETLVRRQKMNGPQERHYRAWGEAFHRAVAGRVGYVPGAVYHLWHGDIGSRQYETRFDILARIGFDPFEDIAPTSSGVWRWISEKPEMHAAVRDYFYARREDG
jgi:hypothetical protein